MSAGEVPELPTGEQGSANHDRAPSAAKGPKEKAKDAGTIFSSVVLAAGLILLGFVVTIASLKATGSSVNSLIQKVAASTGPGTPSPAPRTGR
jgi:hypothetical protein